MVNDKYISRFLALIVVICVLSSILCSCSSSNNDNMRDSFAEFHSDIFDKNTFYTSSNTEMSVLSLDKENVKRNARVVLSLIVGASDKTENNTYQWLQHSYDERKTELRQCANLVIDFAKSKGWKNDYYLYVEITNIYDSCSIVYDYERDSIYIPNCEEVFIDMYNDFGTFSKKDLSETQAGKDFLIENSLATIKHNEIEYNSIYSYKVYIMNGEFGSFGDDDSTIY